MSNDDLIAPCDGDHDEPACADPECWLRPPVDRLTPSAPKRIWLCVSDDKDHYAEPFPDGDLEGITWCDEKPCDCTVEYVRADIAERAAAEIERLRALLREVLDTEVRSDWVARVRDALARGE